MSFRMRLPNAEYFADLVKAISAVVEEGTFVVDEKSIKMVSMDPAHISLVDFELDKSAAEEYVCSEPMNITVSITELLKFLKRAKKSESITLLYESDKKKLTVVLSDVASSKERSFTMNTLEPVASRTAIPNLTFEAAARVNTDALADAVEDTSLVSDYVKFTISPDAVILSAKGEVGAVQIKLSKAGAAVYEIKADKEVWANFSINYVEKIIKAAKTLSEELTIELSTNKPIRFGFPIQSGKLGYLVAPRIETA
ncbi:MAG: proliferating cell nuclear antigen (pcna) [Thaumarchaeota archaeon]|jgi:proliferating cell nuclear antigen|nr:proliferating cell nuclear antigen (pcna) [Candidatus Terraquivivens yellowstonensis]MCL7394877.1 proliferating cell nuclear antigen (pcna) [Candidatus Terraquivivens yellowstonensis]